MRKITTFIMCMIFAISISAQVRTISKDEFPAPAIEFVNTWYSNYTNPVYFVEYDFKRVDDYEVRFDNGTKLEFDKQGNVKTIDCGRNDTINKKLLPIKIQRYLSIKYPNNSVIEYTVDDYGHRWVEYEVDLNNGLSLTFNKNFKVTEIDK